MQQRSPSRSVALMALGCILCLTGVDSLEAQVKQTPRGQFSQTRPRLDRPTLSPYTGLLNDNNSLEQNYFSNVRPRQQFQRNEQGLATQLKSVESRVQSAQRPEAGQANTYPISTGRMSATGHPTSFGNLEGYFPSASQSR